MIGHKFEGCSTIAEHATYFITFDYKEDVFAIVHAEIICTDMFLHCMIRAFKKAYPSSDISYKKKLA